MSSKLGHAVLNDHVAVLAAAVDELCAADMTRLADGEAVVAMNAQWSD